MPGRVLLDSSILVDHLRGEGVSELRLDFGPGYRVYYKKRGRQLVIPLAGGDKSTQAKAIKKAQRLALGLSE